MTKRKPTAPDFTVENIVPGLQPLAVPVEWLREMPGNPRRGLVERLARSYETFGQRKPLVVNLMGQEDGHPIGYVEAGNHGLKAMRDQLGWQYVAVVWVEDDENTAKAYSLADNNLHDLGTYDEDSLSEMVRSLADGSLDLLDVVGFSDGQLDRMIRATAAHRPDLDKTEPPRPDAAPPAYDPMNPGLGTPVISTTIVFDDEMQRESWYRLLRHLRLQYPECDTNSERLTLFIDDLLGPDTGN